MHHKYEMEDGSLLMAPVDYHNRTCARLLNILIVTEACSHADAYAAYVVLKIYVARKV